MWHQVSGKLSAVAVAGLLGLYASTASSNPVQAVYTDLTPCDSHPTQTLPEELGLGAGGGSGQSGPFPADEAISYSVSPIDLGTCGIPGNLDDDWLVKMTNLTATSFVNLFFVANSDYSFDNFDGQISEVGSQNSGRAMRIDNLALNQPLLSEDGNPDLIFEPGETWDFIVLNFTSGAQPIFVSHARGCIEIFTSVVV